MSKRNILLLALVFVLGGLLGWLLRSDSHDHDPEAPPAVEAAAVETWTCSMHPQIRQPEAGDCPICGMDLIPLVEDAGDIDPAAVRMTPTAIQLANVRTMRVGSAAEVASPTVRLTGKVLADETRQFTQTAHVPGRIERLYVDFEGARVRAGQTIARIYAPELITAQQELLQAQALRESQPALFAAAREKLKNWKLTDVQIDGLLAADEPITQFPVRADVSGYVVEKRVRVGDYVAVGEPLYTVADLSRVWIAFDLYENDLAAVDVGDRLRYTVAALPGDTYSADITYIDPVIDPATRVARARAEVRNVDRRLKPEMLVRGRLQPGGTAREEALVVPRSAVLWTGERSVVYVRREDARGVHFALREVTLGAQLGDRYVVEAGLEPGEEIAVNGTFSIDAAAQLAGKPSMMNPDGIEPTAEETAAVSGDTIVLTDAQRATLGPAFDAYFALQTALADDELPAARRAAAELARATEGLGLSLGAPLRRAAEADDLATLRAQFLEISNTFIALAKSYDAFAAPVYLQYCPMADDNRGASWLSRQEQINNPYFGASMLRCGEVREDF